MSVTAGRNFGMRKKIRNAPQERGNPNAWNAKKRCKKNAGTGNAKGKMRNEVYSFSLFYHLL